MIENALKAMRKTSSASPALRQHWLKDLGSFHLTSDPVRLTDLKFSH